MSWLDSFSIQKIKELIRNPLIFWNHQDTRLMTQLLEVRFWNSLVYSKSWGVQTSDEPVLYNVLRDLSQKSTLSYDTEYGNQTNWYEIFSNLLDVCFKNTSLFENIYDRILSHDELRDKFFSNNLIQQYI